VSEKKLKSVNIWQSYKQERDCLVHFLRLLAVYWPDAQSARDNHALACNFAKYSPLFLVRLLGSSSGLRQNWKTLIVIAKLFR